MILLINIPKIHLVFQKSLPMYYFLSHILQSTAEFIAPIDVPATMSTIGLFLNPLSLSLLVTISYNA